MIEQICRSLAYGLAAQIKDDTVPGPQKPAARDVQQFLAANTQTCINTFFAEWPPSTPNWIFSFSSISGEWNLPGDQDYSTDFTNVQATFSSTITDVWAPEGPDTCTDLSSNDHEIIFDAIQPLDIDLDIYLDNADGDLIGPVYGGAQIAGSADFASDLTSCTDPKCSRASISYDGNNAFSIDRMSLYVDGALVVSNGVDAETIYDGRIDLLTPATGTWSIVGGDTVYEIPSGGAEFLVTGQSDGDFATLAVSLTTSITATESAGDWTFDAFTLTFTDDSSNLWTADVGTSVWFE